MSNSILVPGIAAVFFFIHAGAWMYAIVWYRSPFSHLWYGKRWASRFTPEQRRTSQQIGAFCAAGSLFLGLMYGLMAVAALFSEAHGITSIFQWGAVGLAVACYLGAISRMARRSSTV